MAEYDPFAVITAARLARESGQLSQDQHQQIHNTAASEVWMRRVREMQQAGAPAQTSSGDALFQQYGPRQTALGDEARQAAARRFTDVSSGNVQATFRGSKMSQDPRFQSLYRDDQKAADALYQRTYGQSINEAMMGDQLGGNASVSDVRRQQNAPEMQKAIFERMRGIEGAYGANPMDLIAPFRQEEGLGYNPDTGISYIPGKSKTNEFGETITEPARQVHLPPEMYERLQNDTAMLAGYGGQGELMRKRAARAAAAQQAEGSQRSEYEQLKQRREAEMVARNTQSVPQQQQLTGPIGNALSVFSKPPPRYPQAPAPAITDADIWERIKNESLLRNPENPSFARNY